MRRRNKEEEEEKEEEQEQQQKEKKEKKKCRGWGSWGDQNNTLNNIKQNRIQEMAEKDEKKGQETSYSLPPPHASPPPTNPTRQIFLPDDSTRTDRKYVVVWLRIGVTGIMGWAGVGEGNGSFHPPFLPSPLPPPPLVAISQECQDP